MTLTALEDAPPTAAARLCAYCSKPLQYRPGRGRPIRYCGPECRRSAEFQARRENRANSPAKAAKGQPETLNARISDPGKLARRWFDHRYPADYRPCGDGRSPSGFHTFLAVADYPGTIGPSGADRFTVRTVKGSDIEVTELAKWIGSLPRPPQSDFAFRAVEVFSGRGMTRALMRGPDDRVSHDVLDTRIDPVTLRELRDYYAPGECYEPGCHKGIHGNGLCRGHYDKVRYGSLVA